MSYLLRNDKEKRGKKVVFIFTLLIFIFFAFFVLNFYSDFFAKSINIVAVPIWKAKSFLVSKNEENLHFFKSKKNLLAENRKLKNELKEIELKSLAYDEVFLENENLKVFLNRNPDAESLVLSVVLAKPPVSPYDTLIIDVGDNYGISRDDLVMTTGNLVLGYVVEVYSETSKVSLFSSYGSKINAENLKNSFPVEVHGKGGGNFYAKVPRDSDFAIGDVIVAPGLDIMVLGTVFDINNDPVSSFSDIYIKSPISIFELKNILVKISD